MSSIELGRRCQRAWAYAYIEGRREPELPWAFFESAKWDAKRRGWARADGAFASSRQRSLSLGKAMHAARERWYQSRGEERFGHDFPAIVAQRGIDLLPHAERVHAALVEQPLGLGASGVAVVPSDSGGPTRAIVRSGIKWAGFRDLVVRAPGEFVRLGLSSFCADGVLLVDYKSTSSIDRYAMTPEELRANLQANLYALDVAEVSEIDPVPCRWLYSETKDRNAAKAVDALIDVRGASAIVAEAAALAMGLDMIERTSDASMNTSACGEYGGCQYHMSAGGPCEARRPIGSLVQLRKKGEEQMAIDASVFTNFQKAKADAAGAAPAPATTHVVPDVTTDTAPPAPDAPKTRKPRAPAPASELGELVAAVTRAKAEHEAAGAALKKAYADLAAHASEAAK